MSSTTTKIENGVVVFIGGKRKRHPETCTYCSRQRIAVCDFKTVAPGTCGAALCGQCRRSVGGDVDHCRVHQVRGDKEAGL